MARAVDHGGYPRVFITTYIYLLYKVVIWYMEPSKPKINNYIEHYWFSKYCCWRKEPNTRRIWTMR